ncbi:hypothetical protein BOTBODRAFT_186534 [Botryobasidium botryosum FD-172 SS1]|uniref:F-box domain-containing protein n=1 Tax=Botryobasidium botryosum (strain FD-172 SS1) TaxID=930990 RepID=A0A067ML81_BOTB1|nr:hypothetical protein BOTBODRAFT_186534 [Botryobasidium botryosum FD-172 SS1]
MDMARRLSADIIHNIYRQCSDTEALIKISHVCQMWRRTLHNSTEFWMTIDLNSRKRDPDLKAAYWLARSGDRLLTIQVHSGWGAGDIQQVLAVEACIVRLAITLRNCMSRWESVNIRTHSRAIDLIISICSGYALSLKSLIVQATERSLGTEERLLIPLYLPIEHQASNIALCVSIHGYIPRFTTFGLLFTDLAVQYDFVTTPKADDILRMLQSCPNLGRCHLNAIGSDHIGAPSLLTETVMHRLTHFSMSWSEDAENIFNFIQFPALQSIILQQVDWTTAAMGSLWRVLRASRFVSYIVITDEDPAYESNTTPAPFHEDMLTLEAVTSLEVCGNPLTRPILQRLSLPHVQKLDLTEAPFDVVHRYISTSTDLRDLSLHGVIDIPMDPSPIPVSLPALASLYITGFPGIIDYMHTPHLRSLVLIHEPTGPARLPASLRALIERSSPALTTLGLHGIDITDEDIIWCLERLPQVENLDLSSCSISDAVLRALAAPPSSQLETASYRLLPRLERIELSNNTHVTPQGVIEFLAARNSGLALSALRITGKLDFAGRVSREEAQIIMAYGDFFSSLNMIVYSMGQ